VYLPLDGSDVQPKIGFVPQQDVLPPALTVREALAFAARLRLPEHVPVSEKLARVDEVIDQLGLERVADTRIGGVDRRGISGGEMRRLTIGMELVARPDVLILDEPTSGLDAVSASRLAQLLHSVAHNPDCPTTIIASIHQPSSKLYQTFDTVTLLAHGQAQYSGPGGLAPAEYFASKGQQCPTGYNVADFLLEVASEPSPNTSGSYVDGSNSSWDGTRPETKADAQEHEMDTLEKGN
jgi:ABC-type multidrug transport system ATPase subunit